MDVQAIKLANGDLELRVDAETQAELAASLEGPAGYWGTFAELFESYSCNGGFTPFDAGQGNPFVGLTSAPCIAESMTTEDNGDNRIEGSLWAFSDYCLRDPLRELAEEGRTVFDFVATEEESGDD